MTTTLSRPRVRIRVRDLAGVVQPTATVTATEIESGRVITRGLETRWNLFAPVLPVGVHDLRVSAPALAAQERRVRILERDSLETFVLGAPDLPYYFRGRVKVPFDVPLSVAVAFVPGASARAGEIRALAQRVSNSSRPLEEPDSNRETIKQGVCSFVIPGADPALAAAFERAARALPYVQAAGVVVDRTARSTSFLTQEIVVRLKHGASMPPFVAHSGIDVRRALPYIPDTSVAGTDRLDSMALLDVCNQLAGDPAVEWAEPNLFSTMAIHSNDPLNTPFLQPHHGIIGSEAAWKYGNGTATTLAVLDLDGYPAHEDLVDRVAYRYNFPLASPALTLGEGHGTRAAGIAFATLNNGIGIAGVAGNASAIAIQLGATFDTTYAAAFVWAAGFDSGLPNPARLPAGAGAAVLSCSWGIAGVAAGALSTSAGGVSSCVFDLLENQGRGGSGAVVVFSAGNDGVDVAQASPFAAYPTNLAVTSVSTSPPDQRVICNTGADVDLCAPGGGPFADGSYGAPSVTTSTGITANALGQLYDDFAQTSCACPQVAGGAALLISIKPALTAAQVRNTLCTTAVKIDPAGGNWSGGLSPFYGFGRIDLGAAAGSVCGKWCKLFIMFRRVLTKLFNGTRRSTTWAGPAGS